MDLEGNVVEGDKKPSSEWGLHTVFYVNKPDAGAVVHTHSAYCTTFACLNMPIKALHYVIGGAGTAEVPCAPYCTFGTRELAEAAIKACGKGKAVLLANHGLLTCGPEYGILCGNAVSGDVSRRTGRFKRRRNGRGYGEI